MSDKGNLPIKDVFNDVRFIPATKESRFTTLFTMYTGVDVYHLEEFLKHNDDTDVYIISDSRKWEVPNVWNEFGWKNNDVLLRDWWSKNRDKITCKKLLYIEHDVLVTTKITDEMFNEGVRTADVFHLPVMTATPEESWSNEPWWWSQHGDRLPLKLKRVPASGFATVLFFNTDVLELIISPEWDEVFQQDIISEIRLPTLFNYYKVQMENWDPNLGFSRILHTPLSVATEDPFILNKIKNLEPGFYHPIKSTLNVFFTNYNP